MMQFFAQQPATTWLISVVIILAMIIALYFARPVAHQFIRAFFRVFYESFRMVAHFFMRVADQRVKRNKDVLLELGREETERHLEREFSRVSTVVASDFKGYPELQRKIDEQITAIEESFARSTSVPPPAPEWVEAVETVTQLATKSQKDAVVGKLLDSLQDTAVVQQDEAMDEYRNDLAQRHKHLKAMLPFWRKLSHSVNKVSTTIHGLVQSSKQIDRHMSRYEEICNGSDRMVRSLKASAFTQFFVATLVVGIAIAGAFVNFNLIALPMSEMVGASNRVAGFKVADVAALVIILIEMVMGLFLMEALRITRLFPVIGTIEDKIRVRMAWSAFIMLFSLAAIEAALAFMRDQIAADQHALRASLVEGAIEPEKSQATLLIPMIGQMVMGFLLPFALMFVAIPLEMFVNTSRTLIGDLQVVILRSIGFLCRILALIFNRTCDVVIRFYDMLVFLPLWFEKDNKRSENKLGNKADAVSRLRDDPLVGDVPTVALESTSDDKDSTASVASDDEEQQTKTVTKVSKARKTPSKPRKSRKKEDTAPDTDEVRTPNALPGETMTAGDA